MKTLTEKIESGREYRAVNLEPHEEMSVRGYATTFEQPYYLYRIENENGDPVTVYEKVARNAFDNTDMSDVIFQFDHTGRVFARLSNNTMTLETDDTGLLVDANLGGTDAGRQLYEEIRNGYVTKMSFGFSVDKAHIEDYGEHDYVRVIDSIRKLYDVSAVSYPQNENTNISVRSLIDGEIEQLQAERLEAEKRVRERKEKMEKLTMRLQGLKGEKNGD